MIPMLAVAIIDEDTLDRSVVMGKQFADFPRRQPWDHRDQLQELGVLRGEPGHLRLPSAVGMGRLEKLFDERVPIPLWPAALVCLRPRPPLHAQRPRLRRHDRL